MVSLPHPIRWFQPETTVATQWLSVNTLKGSLLPFKLSAVGCLLGDLGSGVQKFIFRGVTFTLT